MNVSELKDLADNLGSEDSEAHKRSAINRYYYFSHLMVRGIANSRGKYFTGDGSDHREVIDFLRRGLNRQGKADKLMALFENRKDADYDLTMQIDESDVRDSSDLAEDIRSSLHGILPDRYS